MKTLMKRAACLVLGACLLLSGCAKSAGGAPDKNAPGVDGKNVNVAMGRYIETNVDLPQGDLNPHLIVQDDGSLLVYNAVNGAIVCYKSADGKSWEQTSADALEGLPQTEKGFGDLINVVRGKDGGTYALYRDKNFQTHLVKSADDKTLREITIEGWDQQGVVGQVILDDPKIDGPQSTADPMNTDEKSTPEGQKAKGPKVGGQMIADGQDNADGQKSLGGMMSFPQSLDALENGDILIGYFDKVVRYGSDGTEKQSYSGQGSSFAADSETILMFNKEHSAIDIISLSTGEVVNSVPLASAAVQTGGIAINIGAGGSTMTLDESGALYSADDKGIHRLAPGGELWETVVDGELTSLSLPTVMISSLQLDGKGGFYVLMSSEKAMNLSHYTYSADTPSVPGNEISVYALANNETVRQAIGEFQREHPDVKVTFRYGLGEDGAATVADVIRTLNTELLAGKGPDVLLLDGLPVESYIEKGVLMDLGEALKPLLDSGAIMQNIADCYAKDGKIYTMPTRFSFPVMVGGKEALDAAKSLHALADAVAQSGDANFLSGNTRKGRFAQFFLTSAPAWMKADGTLDQAALAEYLSDVKRIGDVCGDDSFVEERPMLSAVAVGSAGSTGQLGGSDELGATDRGINSLMKLYKGESRLHMQMLNGFFDLAFPVAAKDRIENGAIVPMTGQSANVFVPHGIVGINNAGKHRDLAVQFVQSLFGDSVQNTNLGDGFPVNTRSIEKSIAESNANMISLATKQGDDMITAGAPSQENMRALSDLIRTLNKPSTVDTVLLEMIQNECDAFFAGEKTAEQTAAAIAERTQAYLAEVNGAKRARRFCSSPPSLLGVTTLVLVPFGDAVRRSFFEAMSGNFVGLANYKAVLSNEAFKLAAGNTLRFIGVCIPALLALSLLLALLLRATRRGGDLYKTAFLLPMAIPVASVVLLWTVLFHENGMLSRITLAFGGERADWMNTDTAFTVLVLSYLWRNAGYDMVLFLAGLGAISPSLYEAARVDGAGRLAILRFITLPALLPTLFTVAVLSLLNSFKVFREAFLVAGSYPHKSIYMLQHLFNNWFAALDIQKLCAAAVLVALFILALILLLQKLWGSEELS